MSRAFLVLNNMPENCKNCQLETDLEVIGRYLCTGTSDWKTICRIEQDTDENGKPDWCPLSPIPEYRIEFEGEDWEQGYNACILETFGEEDDDDDG